MTDASQDVDERRERSRGRGRKEGAARTSTDDAESCCWARLLRDVGHVDETRRKGCCGLSSPLRRKMLTDHRLAPLWERPGADFAAPEYYPGIREARSRAPAVRERGRKDWTRMFEIMIKTRRGARLSFPPDTYHSIDPDSHDSKIFIVERFMEHILRASSIRRGARRSEAGNNRGRPRGSMTARHHNDAH